MNCLDYIHSSWDRFTSSGKYGKDMIALPNRFVAPNDLLFKDELFYWDSYFIIRGLILDDRVNLAVGMLEDLLYLVKNYGHVPSCNKRFNLGVSQPPFLTSMGIELYRETGDKDLLTRVGESAEKELSFWLNRKRRVLGLSRYYGRGTHTSAELESSWDFTSRFNGAALNYLPVDLNALLYKYFVDLAFIGKETGEPSMKRFFKRKAESMKEKIIDLMWDPDIGFFFDYNFITGKRRRFFTVAGFYPMWVGMVNRRMANKIVSNIDVLMGNWGIVTTQKSRRMKTRVCQWDWPNGWPNQQLVIVEALRRYGFRELANSIASKWVDLNCRVFNKTGKLWEKYDVVSGDIGKPGLYPTQPGFGWTNAVFLVFKDMLS